MPHAPVGEKHRDRTKSLRKAMTPAETLLWRYIKAHRIDGLGFRRQFPIRNYIVDFVCLSARLVVELDGSSHDFDEQREADRTRDAFLTSEGFQVLRFSNNEALTNLAGVIEVIRHAAASRMSGSPPSLTLPHTGGGNRKPPPTDIRGQP